MPSYKRREQVSARYKGHFRHYQKHVFSCFLCTWLTEVNLPYIIILVMSKICTLTAHVINLAFS